MLGLAKRETISDTVRDCALAKSGSDMSGAGRGPLFCDEQPWGRTIVTTVERSVGGSPPRSSPELNRPTDVHVAESSSDIAEVVPIAGSGAVRNPIRREPMVRDRTPPDLLRLLA